MFKPGDKIQLIDDFWKYKIGDFFTIKEYKEYYVSNEEFFVRFKEIDSIHSCFAKRCKLAYPKKIPITETDFLDCFQANFREEY